MDPNVAYEINVLLAVIATCSAVLGVFGGVLWMKRRRHRRLQKLKGK